MPDNLCVNCSICCDGTLYGRLAVTEEEIERLDNRGEFFTKPDGSLRMRLGCTHLGRNGACQVYEDRPGICRTYRCRLLKRVDAGQTPEAHAVEIIREIRAAEANTRARISHALGQEAFANNTGTIHDAIERLEDAQTESEPSYSYTHAMMCYDHFVNLIRLHLKADF